jgi:hypothetical protein
MIDLKQYDMAKLAKPQEDQYDTKVFAEIVAKRWNWKPVVPTEGTPTWIEGRVAIVPYPNPLREKAFEVPPDDAKYQHASERFKCWPEQREQFFRIVNAVSGYGTRPNAMGCGCSCGPLRAEGNPFFKDDMVEAKDWGNVWATIDSATGFLEGTIHELSHWKGYALGIFIEDWEKTIFENDPPPREVIDYIKTDPRIRNEISYKERQEVWVPKGLGYQPLRPDKLRPLGALFQEIWTCVHIIDLHLRVVDALDTPSSADEFDAPKRSLVPWATYHIERTLEGHRDLLQIAKPTPVGAPFFNAYCQWVDDLVAKAKQVYGEEALEKAKQLVQKEIATGN